MRQALQHYKEAIDSYTLSLMNHQLAATETDIRWLDGLIQAERRQVRQTRTPRRRAARSRTAPQAPAPMAPQAAAPPSMTPQKERA